MKKAIATERLNRQLALLGDVRSSREEESRRRWQRDSLTALERIFGEAHRHSKDFKGIQFYPIIVTSSTSTADYWRAASSGLQQAQIILESAVAEVQEYWDNDPMPDASRNMDVLSRVRVVCQRLPLFAKRLANRQRSRIGFAINDEYDVQDVLHALLTIDFDDIRREEWTPSFAGASSRIDLLLKAEGLVIEAKMTRDGLLDRQVGEELLIDIAKYQTHPDCKTLLCFVYDPHGRLVNPIGLQRDLARPHADLDVHIIVAPSHG